MKKKCIIPVVIIVALLLVLFLPIPQGSYDDGGTRDYNALTYKIVDWNKMVVNLDENGQPLPYTTYSKTSIFWHPDNKKNIDELWEIEIAKSGTPPFHPLYEKYPEYFALTTFKGVDVYVWQMGENLYYCGALSGTNRLKTEEEIYDLMANGATIEEMKTILSLCKINKELVSIIPISNPLSSYLYEIDDEYQSKIEAVFWGE